MKRVMSLAAMAGLIFTAAAYAHLCNNVYRSPDRIIVKPEKSVTTVDKSEDVRVFVKNNFPVTINKVALTVKSDDAAVQADVTPKSVRAMKPGEKTTFTVKITVAEATPAQKHKLSIGISALQIGFESMEESPVPKLRQILENPKANPSTQVLAAEALARREDPIGFQFLKDMAKRRGTDYQSRAIRAMGRIGHASTIPLLQEMLQERDGYLRGNAIIALALAKAQTTPLEGALTDPDKFVRTCAQAALTYRGSKDYMKALKEAMGDPDEYVQVAAAWGLAAAGEKEGISLLNDYMTYDSTKDIRLRIFTGEALISLPDRDQESKAE